MNEALGFFGTFREACFRPRALFELWAKGRVRAHPLSVYVAAQACNSAGIGAYYALMGEQPLALVMIVVAGLGVMFAPLFWWLSSAYVHAGARLLGGPGTLRDAGSIVGLGAAPRVLSLVPVIGYAGEVWSVVVSVKGLKVLRGLKTWAAVVLMVSLPLLSAGAAFALRATVMEAFKMPSASMYPSLEVGDHLFVSKAAYGFSHGTLPHRGDVIVFEDPYPRGAEALPFLKRVIALPGDTLIVDDGHPVINGWRVPHCRLGVAGGASSEDPAREGEFFVEFLDGRAHLIVLDSNRSSRMEGPYVVPSGEVYVLGDNRNNSSDSRSWRNGAGGGVRLDQVQGRAWWLWLPPARFGKAVHGTPQLPAAARALQPALDNCLAHAPSPERTTPPSR